MTDTKPNYHFYKLDDTRIVFPGLTPIDVLEAHKTDKLTLLIEVMMPLEKLAGFSDEGFSYDEYSGWWLLCDNPTYVVLQKTYKEEVDFSFFKEWL